MILSLIIPTRNRASLLAQTLESLTFQEMSSEDYEILVIDNGSTDNTSDIVNRYINKLPNLAYHYESTLGLHAGRHKGLLLSKGNILVYADDDIEALPTWLTAIKEGFTEPDVAMVGGNNLPMFVETPPNWLYKMWQRTNASGLKSLPALSIIEFPEGNKEISPYQIWGCNFSIRKEVLIAARGFHPDAMPKNLLCYRGDGETHVSRYVNESNLKCVFKAGATVFHKVTPERMTFDYFYARGFNQGISDSYTNLRNSISEINIGKKYNLRRIVKWLLIKLKELINDSEIQHALKKMKHGYDDGYTFHQKCYRENPEIRKWVHQKQYF